MQAFLLGSTGFVGWTSCLLMAGVWLLCLVAAWLLARGLDGLALGEATALSLGLRLAPLRARWWQCWRWRRALRSRNPA